MSDALPPLPMQVPLPIRVRARRKPAVSDAVELVIPPCEIHPQATALLAEVLARLHDVEQPAIQFIAASAESGARRSPIAREFAVACVAKLGRTLLLSPPPPSGNRHATTPYALPDPTRPASRVIALVPDTGVPGLYHRQIDETPFEPAQLASPGGRSGSKPFRVVVLSSPAPSLCPASLIQSARCHGSILTVQAGITPLSAVQTTVRQVQHAGGTVLGTVLVDAPRPRWPFTRRRAAAAT